ncbi:MAG TPA: hypothetical protein VHE55_17980 [Fimbriimonadaceae bacterium]|nr:hypothetical protein [Fimbriimonadaceae bacterium]
MMRKHVLPPACFAAVCLILMLAMGPFATYLALLATLFAGWATVGFFVVKRHLRYDLGALRELHESGGPPPEDDLPEVEPDAGVVCPCCGTVYARWMLICPNCGH